ncbi:glycosyltransferase [Peptacetobacter sp.]|uniref:glycosyltransferase n=1 Tax=Peptacetobacter sp. TaxID=2991975 RepID=UPI0026113F94|nr:glycosyltransferase [Peptacetobacter sp.]
MIPKKIHYVWIGGPKGNLENICINSWKEKLPEYEIIEWNEKNFDIEKEIKGKKFLEECYKQKLWAFIADYIRLKVLYDQGGLYMDTDMQILKDLTPLMEENRLFLGYESKDYINGAIIGVEAKHPFIKDVLDFYDDDIMKCKLYTIPMIITHILNEKYKKIDRNNFSEGIKAYDEEYFYPFGFKENYTDECITENTYGIHWWGKTWVKKRNYFLESKHLKGFDKIYKCIKIFGSNTLLSLKRRK